MNVEVLGSREGSVIISWSTRHNIPLYMNIIILIIRLLPPLAEILEFSAQKKRISAREPQYDGTQTMLHPLISTLTADSFAASRSGCLYPDKWHIKSTGWSVERPAKHGGEE